MPASRKKETVRRSPSQDAKANSKSKSRRNGQTFRVGHLETEVVVEPKRSPRRPPPRKTSWGRLFLIMFIGVGVGVGLFTFLRFDSFKNDVFGGRNDLSANVNAAPNAPPDFSKSALVQKIKNGERFSVLVLGYGGPEHDGPYLTDTILQMVYEPAKKTVSLINVPRDLYVLVPFGGGEKGTWTKINQAFSIVMNLYDAKSLDKRYNFDLNNQNTKTDAAALLSKDTVERVTGVPVDYWLTVNFDGFIKLIDAIGGVSVNVEKAFDDYAYSKNPGVNDGRNHLHFDAGVQTMNGLRAINFVRSRYSEQENGDLSRSKRQMKMIQAVKTQVLRPDILLKTPGVLDALQGNVRTSVAFDEVMTLANYFNSDEGRASGDLIFHNLLIGMDLLKNDNKPMGFVFLPAAGQGNYTQIQAFIKDALNAPAPTPAPLSPTPK
jgi:polyisoprenyl-teichoic acid--peptidoglycan teichoic acid transferase